MKNKLQILVFMIAALLGCGEDESPDSFSGSYQWADTVYRFSSEYGGSFSAQRILGVPSLWPEPCECGGSWAHQTRDGSREFIEIGFTAHAAPASSIAIFENYTPGAVDTVYVKNPGTGEWVKVWDGPFQRIGEDTSRIFVVSFPKTAFNVTDVRFSMASDSVIGWNEYDAVAISEGVLPASYDTTGGGSFIED